MANNNNNNDIEDNDAQPISKGDFEIGPDGSYGLYKFYRVEGRGPLPVALEGRFTDPKYAIEAYDAFTRSKPRKGVAPLEASEAA